MLRLLIEPRPFRRAIMGHRPARRLANQSCIFSERTCPMPWRPLLPRLASFSEFAIIDKQVEPARGCIDLDMITVTHQGQRTADKGFGRDVANATAPGGARGGA